MVVAPAGIRDANGEMIMALTMAGSSVRLGADLDGEPRLRATAMALYFISLYLLGGGLGPIVVGLLSDHFSHLAMLAAGATQMSEAFRAVGLHDAMLLIPLLLLLSMLALLMGARTFAADTHRQTAVGNLAASQSAG